MRCYPGIYRLMRKQGYTAKEARAWIYCLKSDLI